MRSALSFTWKGLQITMRDIVEVGSVLRKRWSGAALESKDIALVKRTINDVVMLVPFSVIMIVPLTPPGHVFAFSMLKRCFPSAVPSGFTEQRQVPAPTPTRHP